MPVEALCGKQPEVWARTRAGDLDEHGFDRTGTDRTVMLELQYVKLFERRTHTGDCAKYLALMQFLFKSQKERYTRTTSRGTVTPHGPPHPRTSSRSDLPWATAYREPFDAMQPHNTDMNSNRKRVSDASLKESKRKTSRNIVDLSTDFEREIVDLTEEDGQDVAEDAQPRESHAYIILSRRYIGLGGDAGSDRESDDDGDGKYYDATTLTTFTPRHHQARIHHPVSAAHRDPRDPQHVLEVRS